MRFIKKLKILEKSKIAKNWAVGILSGLKQTRLTTMENTPARLETAGSKSQGRRSDTNIFNPPPEEG